ncbi:response regulator transcription factor [Dyella flagellata]|uniref:DNA-binding response regulator n=1 Tax=Dyella flagellata TaxID=1867833 RepID=A0ABQ5XAI0_9GAMM|nr:response regulator transcription factor [Dyella flagellata]GLQ87540.1 DNA-binding response regulator [Dyella flagellata]
MKQKVILADDHPIIRFILQHMLHSSGVAEVVAEAASPSQLLKLLSTTPCDVIVTDFCMPDVRGRDGLALIRRLARVYPGTPVIVFTALRHPGLLRAALQGGACGLVHKAHDRAELARALLAVSKGRTYVGEELGVLLSAHTTSQRAHPPLTQAEMEVLRLFAHQGLATKQIAAHLHRSPVTVSRHKHNAQAKLGLNTDQQLLDYCRQWDCRLA